MTWHVPLESTTDQGTISQNLCRKPVTTPRIPWKNEQIGQVHGFSAVSCTSSAPVRPHLHLSRVNMRQPVGTLQAIDLWSWTIQTSDRKNFWPVSLSLLTYLTSLQSCLSGDFNPFQKVLGDQHPRGQPRISNPLCPRWSENGLVISSYPIKIAINYCGWKKSCTTFDGNQNKILGCLPLINAGFRNHPNPSRPAPNFGRHATVMMTRGSSGSKPRMERSSWQGIRFPREIHMEENVGYPQNQGFQCTNCLYNLGWLWWFGVTPL